MTTLVLAGCGNMGYAMLSAWIGSDVVAGGDVCVVEPVAGLRDQAGELGVGAVASPADIAPDFEPDIVLFAVKPQVMGEVVPGYRRFTEAGAACVSIAAGTKIALFERLLGGDTPIIRCMPNTPAAIGKGMMVLAANENASEPLRQTVSELLGANGRVEWIGDENLMDAVTAVSGSGPAYVFHFIECLTAAGTKAGLDEKTAATLAMQTVYGAAALAFESGEDPATLRQQVTSPNGTTAAALEILMTDERLQAIVTEAVDAARRRSIELG